MCISCVCVHEHISETARLLFTKFSGYVNHGRGSVFWRRCDALSTSGFMDDAIFADNDEEKATRKKRIQ